ncbi:MAG: GNAT family N-acetyltransferase [Fidelibacterota bacterium]|nr:MAG: GNAT family N-acetyltransferase [Candidatus Neomarinimicrobiota bacterium]
MTSGEVVIEPAREADLSVILKLLSTTGLKGTGLQGHLGTTLVARQRETIVGCAALERYGASAMLRSVAVRPGYQGQRLGRRLTEAALDLACANGITHVYLLTDTAERFFRRQGFRHIERSEIPEVVQESEEFNMACAVTAVAMKLTLPGRRQQENNGDNSVST